MQASKILKQQIIIEIMALVGLALVICYAAYAIDKNNKNHVVNTDGFVTIVDDEKMKTFDILSDGEGMRIDGATFTVTNNNSEERLYKVVLNVDAADDVKKYIRVCIDNLYVENLLELDNNQKDYILLEHNLAAGYTKVHSIKIWYKLGAPDSILKENVKFTYKLGNE